MELKPCRKCLEYTPVDDMIAGFCLRCYFAAKEKYTAEEVEEVKTIVIIIKREIENIRQNLLAFLKKNNIPKEITSHKEAELSRRQRILLNLETKLNQANRITGKDFRELRENKNLTLNQTAKLLKISKRKLQNIEKNTVFVSLKESMLYKNLLKSPVL